MKIFSKNRFICEITRGILKKQVKKSKHFFWTCPGWTIDSSVIEQNRRMIQKLEFFDVENQILYSAALKTFLSHAIEKVFPREGRRLILPSSTCKKNNVMLL